MMVTRTIPAGSKLQQRLGIPAQTEFLLALLLFGVQLILKIWNVFHYRFDSDEPQHLHVVWAWTHGLVQYRDVFDNHMPLFHIMWAPVLGLLGEHARDLYAMRLLMLPLYLISIWATFRIGALVYSRQVGTWAAIATGSWNTYYFYTTEFRTDNLWSLFWLLSMLVFLKGGLRWRGALVAGLLLGLAFAVSMKSTIMLLGLQIGTAITLSLFDWKTIVAHHRSLTKRVAVFLGSAALPAVAIIAFFAARGLWPQMRACVFEHNLSAPVSRSHLWVHLLIFPVAIPPLIWVTRKLALAAGSPVGAFRSAFLCSSCGAYLLVLLSFWHHVTRQDFLPVMPLAAVLVVAVVFRTTIRSRVMQLPAPAAALVGAMCVVLVPVVPLQNEAQPEIDLIHDVLTLTAPSDYVFDCKGETVFRPRPVFAVFEAITRDLIRRGLIADDVAGRCVATRAGVIAVGGRLTKADRRFIQSVYLPVRDGICVAGSMLHPKSDDSVESEFEVTIPGEYQVIAADGTAAGLLDGKPYTGPRVLVPGRHQFVAAKAGQPLAAIWAKAAEHHFMPSLPSSSG